MLVLEYNHRGNARPALSLKNAAAGLPIMSEVELCLDQRGDLTPLAHAGNAAMSQFAGDMELRWLARTNNWSWRIHFRSTEG